MQPRVQIYFWNSNNRLIYVLVLRIIWWKCLIHFKIWLLYYAKYNQSYFPSWKRSYFLLNISAKRGQCCLLDILVLFGHSSFVNIFFCKAGLLVVEIRSVIKKKLVPPLIFLQSEDQSYYFIEPQANSQTSYEQIKS